MTPQVKPDPAGQDGAPGDVFGFSVALSNNTALIGATGNDEKGNESGAAYVFEIKAK